MMSWKQLLVTGALVLGSMVAKAEFPGPMGGPIGYQPVAVQQTRISVVNNYTVAQPMGGYGYGYGSHGMPGYGGGYGYAYGGYGGGYGYGGYRGYGGCGGGGHWHQCRSHHRCCNHRRFRSFSLSLGIGFGGFSFGLGIQSSSF